MAFPVADANTISLSTAGSRVIGRSEMGPLVPVRALPVTDASPMRHLLNA